MLTEKLNIFKIEIIFAEIQKKSIKNKFVSTCGHPFKLYFLTSLAIDLN